MTRIAPPGSGADTVGAAMRLTETPYTRPLTGPLKSKVAGRTDHLPVNVPPESFVIPADVVSGLGEGNTENGFHVLDRLFHLPGGSAPGALQRARGGSVPIAAAGGEYVVPPEIVEALGDGDMKKGHKILDAFVKHVRSETIKTMKKLKPPHR